MEFIETLQSKNIQHSWVAIGAFDGVHKGHQALFTTLVTGAHRSGCKAVVITFDPLPGIFFKRMEPGSELSTLDERISLIKATGVDEVIVMRFDHSLAEIDALSFMTALKKNIGLEHLLAGFNFTLGKNRGGTVQQLADFGKSLGYEVDVVEPVRDGDDIVSSSNIRRLLRLGEIRKANRLLGRPYNVIGPVVHGEHRGEKLGFPTANLAIPAERLIPANGVYACKATVDGKTYLAVTNVGVRPTFDNPLPKPRIEPHLLDTEERFYDKTLCLEFFEYLRSEVKYPDADALIAQIKKDVQKTRELFSDGA